jgi:hypothetical protein
MLFAEDFDLRGEKGVAADEPVVMYTEFDRVSVGYQSLTGSAKM